MIIINYLHTYSSILNIHIYVLTPTYSHTTYSTCDVYTHVHNAQTGTHIDKYIHIHTYYR